MSTAGTLQLVLAFGTFVVTLTALVVELIRNQQEE